MSGLATVLESRERGKGKLALLESFWEGLGVIVPGWGFREGVRTNVGIKILMGAV